QNFTARLLESGTVMAAVTSEATPVAGCSVSPLGVLEYRAMAEPAYASRWFPDGVTADALRAAPFVDFDRRDTLQHEWLRAMSVSEAGVPRHYVPASHDYAVAVTLGLGWGMVPLLQESSGLVPLGGPTLRVPLYWQQWNLRSELLDTIAAEIAVEARGVLAEVPVTRTRAERTG
ncbi:MAG: chromosome replication initiation inhibitor protein, partial [Microbacterium sp.]|nr:chromosome replication initiation inhibitor protein [Microbacterium sp.]